MTALRLLTLDFDVKEGYDIFGNQTVFGADGNGFAEGNARFTGNASDGYEEDFYPPEGTRYQNPFPIVKAPEDSPWELHKSSLTLLDQLNEKKEDREAYEKFLEEQKIVNSVFDKPCPPKNSTPNSTSPPSRSPSYQSSPSYQYGL